MTRQYAAKTKVRTARAAIYCRISSDREGRELGVERQEEDCHKLADRLGLVVVETYLDNDISASTKSKKPRPRYLQMLADARAGQFDVILAYTSGRVTRKPRENEDLIELAVEHGTRFEYVRSPSFDLNTSQGRRIARTLAAQDAGEAEDISERVTRTKEQTALNGGYRGGPRPFGFAKDGVTLVDDEAAEIRKVAGDLLAGISLNAACRDLNGRGVTTSTGKPWDGQALSRMMIRPRNAAFVDHYGEILGAAQWPAILPEGTWRAVVALLDDPGRAHGPHQTWLLSGIATCGKCGATVNRGSAPTRGPRPRVSRRAVYICSRKREVARDAEQLDDLVAGLVVERLSRKDAVKLLHASAEQVDVKKLHRDALQLRQEEDQLAKMLGRKTMTPRQFEIANAERQRQLDAIEEQLAVSARKSVFAGVIGAENVEAAWDGLPLDRRRAIVKALLTITLMPARRGRPPGWRAGEDYFDPESIKMQWLQ